MPPLPAGSQVHTQSLMSSLTSQGHSIMATLPLQCLYLPLPMGMHRRAAHPVVEGVGWGRQVQDLQDPGSLVLLLRADLEGHDRN